MKSKLSFLTKMSLNKKIKTKWFLIANILFLILISGLINIDSIIKFFGGDFDDKIEILVIDNTNSFDTFKNNVLEYAKYTEDFNDIDITLFDKSREDAIKEVEEDDKLLLELIPDSDNYLKAKLTSKEGVGLITKTLISTGLNSTRSAFVLNKYEITNEMMAEINKQVLIETEVLSENNLENDMMVTSIMQVIMIPIFMLIMFLVQMIGAEVNEEKTTRSMEIIISNVSPKTHFLSKVIASNLFVLIQGTLLLIYGGIGLIIRLLVSGGDILNGISGELTEITGSIDLTSIANSISYMLPIMIVMLLLTFFAYSLLAGILASMTTNLEDFQQLQTPIMIVSLVGFYLSLMAGMFKGSTFIICMSYIPFISCLLSPTLYILGQVSLIDLLISISLLLGTIYILIKYGLRIYKVGILNYSGTGLWKKMFSAIKNKG